MVGFLILEISRKNNVKNFFLLAQVVLSNKKGKILKENF